MVASAWIGDALDGAVARFTDTESLSGAWLDFVGDRLCITTLCLVLTRVADLGTAPLLFAVHYLTLDAIVTTAFRYFDIGSPNYFFLVDELMFRSNWSIPAKLLSQAPLALLLVGSSGRLYLLSMALIIVWKGLMVARLHILRRRHGQNATAGIE